MLSKEYSSDKPYYHKYGGEGEGDWAICVRSDAWCTQPNGYAALINGFAYPGQDHPVEDGNSEEVWFAGVSAGHIYTFTEPDTYSIFNLTAPDHIFSSGYVWRSVVWEGDTLYLRTYGEGNDSGFLSWLGNMELWKPGFNQYNYQFRYQMIQNWLKEQP